MDGIGAIHGYDLVSGAVVARTRLRKMRVQLNGDHEAAKSGVTVTRSRYLSAIACDSKEKREKDRPENGEDLTLE